MTQYAQTHLQLYRQLQDAAYSADDLLLVDKAYRLAMRLFAGHYRPNHKPFLVHLVGVASILAAARQPAHVVAAGLLHSAYSLGLRREGSRIKPDDRNELITSLGESAERLVYEYSSKRWSVHDFVGPSVDLPSMALETRQLYLMKFADIHEEFLDAGHDFQPQKKLLWDEDGNTSWLPSIADLIDQLGFEQWAREFRQAIDAGHSNLPGAIVGRASSSYILAPGLHNSRWKNRLVRWLSMH